MEKHVEERLIDVEREMNYYKEERENHLDKIELMRKQIQFNEDRPYFSFGGVRDTEAQTEPEESSPYNQECL